MKQNTYSLLSSGWCISDAGASSLMPALIAMIKGNQIAEASPEVIATFAEYDEDEPDYNVVQDMRSDAKYIPVLAIKNTIYKYDQACGPRGTQTMLAMLKAWAADESVMGVVLDHDSGGGQAAGTRELAQYIKNYPKPLVSYCNGIMGSADYWIAAASPGGIILNPNADLVGCIGTMWKHVNLDGILIKEGASIKDIYPPESPRKNEETRALAINNELPLITNILSPGAKLFAADLRSFRPGMNEEVYDGAVYAPEAALAMGLVDRLGTITDAFDEVIAQSKSQKSNNSKLHTMSTTPRAKLQAVLGLTTPLAETAEKGSYLNAEQLDATETAFAAQEGTIATLTTEVATATTATTTAEKALADATAAHTATLTATEATVTTILTTAGLEATGTLSDKLTALAAHQAVLNKKDGAPGAKVIVDANDTNEAGATIVSGVNVSAALGNC